GLTPRLKHQLCCWLGKLKVESSLPRTLRRICLTTDASDHRWGAHLDTHQLSEEWSPDLKRLHINLKELIAVRNALQQWGAAYLRNASILLQIDNTSAMHWIRRLGSASDAKVHLLVVEIFQILDKIGSQ